MEKKTQKKILMGALIALPVVFFVAIFHWHYPKSEEGEILVSRTNPGKPPKANLNAGKGSSRKSKLSRRALFKQEGMGSETFLGKPLFKRENNKKLSGIKVLVRKKNGDPVPGAKVLVWSQIDTFYAMDMWKLTLDSGVFEKIINRKKVSYTNRLGETFIEFPGEDSFLFVRCNGYYGFEWIRGPKEEVTVFLEKEKNLCVKVVAKNMLPVEGVPILISWDGEDIYKINSKENGKAEIAGINRFVDFLFFSEWKGRKRKKWSEGIFKASFGFPLAKKIEKIFSINNEDFKEICLNLPETGAVEVKLIFDKLSSDVPIFVSIFEDYEEGEDGTEFSKVKKYGVVSRGRSALFPFVGLGLKLKVFAEPMGIYRSLVGDFVEKSFLGPSSMSRFSEVTVHLDVPLQFIRVRLLDDSGKSLSNENYLYFAKDNNGKRYNGKGASDSNGVGFLALPLRFQGNEPVRVKLFVIKKMKMASKVFFDASYTGKVRVSLVGRNRKATPIDVVLKPLPPLVAGRVFDKNCQPVYGAKVYLLSSFGYGDSKGLLNYSFTGQSGEFEISQPVSPLMPGKLHYKVYAKKEGVGESQELDVLVPEKGLRIFLDKTR